MKKEKLKIVYTKQKIANKIKKIASMLNTKYKNSKSPLIVICVLKGAFLFTADLIRGIKCPVQVEFVRISSYGSKEVSSGKIDAPLLSLPDLTNKNVLIVEDIVDSGRTIAFLKEYINAQYKPKSLKVACLLNKDARREVDVKADYIGFNVADHFLVGYGLDANEKYRHLPFFAIKL